VVSRPFLVLGLAVACLLGLGHLPRAAAFVIDTTPAGARLHWPPSSIPVRYVINESSVPVAGGAAAVRAAFATWQAVSGTSIRFADGGATTQTSAGSDGTNLIIWRSTNLDPDKFEEGTLAVATTFFSVASGQIHDADIEFNGRDFTWGVSGEPDRIDVQSVALHEIGHLLGFGHTADPATVMHPTLATGAQKRVLTQDEIDAVRTNYPGASPPGPPPAPRPIPAPAPPPAPPPIPGLTPKPMLLEPPSGTAANMALRPTLTFRWSSILGAATYFFEYTGAGRRFGNPNSSSPDSINGFGGAGGGLLVAGTTLPITLEPTIPGGTYQWRVIAVAADGTPRGIFSDAASISLGAQAPGVAASLTGTWDLVEELGYGLEPARRLGVRLEQQGATLTGAWNGRPVAGTAGDGAAEFGYQHDGFATRYAVTVDGATLSGTWTFTDARTGYRSPPRPVRGLRR
jgi:hypothetical protein